MRSVVVSGLNRLSGFRFNWPFGGNAGQAGGRDSQGTVGGWAVTVGFAAIFGFVAVFTLWSFAAPLSSAAIARGRIKVESNRKTIQHLEGGIISGLFVKEGDQVSQGQVLVTLDPTQSDAAAESARSQQDTLLARWSRLIALRKNSSAVVYPPELLARAGEARVAEVMATENAMFAKQIAELKNRREIIEGQMTQINSEIGSYGAEIESKSRQSALIEQEIVSVRELVSKGLAPRPRLLALQRQAAELKGNKGNYAAQVAKGRQKIGELKLSLIQIQATADRENETALADAEAKLSLIGQQLRAAVDVLQRREIVAPTEGRVINLKFVTIGGVVRPGEPLMDLVPSFDKLTVEASVLPSDIDVVHPGLRAEVRLSAYKQRVVPVFYGDVISVSPDAIIAERDGSSYYKAIIEILPHELDKISGIKMVPGMPADVYIETGALTFVDMIIDPFIESFHRALRED